MGRAITMENEQERIVAQIAVIENRMRLMEDCMEELLNRITPLMEEKPVEKKAKKSNKK